MQHQQQMSQMMQNQTNFATNSNGATNGLFVGQHPFRKSNNETYTIHSRGQDVEVSFINSGHSISEGERQTRPNSPYPRSKSPKRSKSQEKKRRKLKLQCFFCGSFDRHEFRSCNIIWEGRCWFCRETTSPHKYKECQAAYYEEHPEEGEWEDETPLN
jgi:hypothetical protein